jgi:LysM repeat protein
VALVWMVMIAAGASMVSGMLSSADREAATSKVMVQPGESVWQVADRVAAGASIGTVVDQIMRLNGLDADHVLRPGDVLVVPVVP